jgi:hypothetical protein
MKISELINKLETLKEENGDIDVVVEYRDAGGSYGGYDAEIYLTKCYADVFNGTTGYWDIKEAIVL